MPADRFRGFYSLIAYLGILRSNHRPLELMSWLPRLLLCAVRSLCVNLLLRVALLGRRSRLPLTLLLLLLLIGLRVGRLILERVLVRRSRLHGWLGWLTVMRRCILAVLSLLLRLALGIQILRRLVIGA
jgi:hypothetical protein